MSSLDWKRKQRATTNKEPSLCGITSAVLGTTSAKSSISILPLGEPPIVMSKKTTGLLSLLAMMRNNVMETSDGGNQGIIRFCYPSWLHGKVAFLITNVQPCVRVPILTTDKRSFCWTAGAGRTHELLVPSGATSQGHENPLGLPKLIVGCSRSSSWCGGMCCRYQLCFRWTAWWMKTFHETAWNHLRVVFASSIFIPHAEPLTGNYGTMGFCVAETNGRTYRNRVSITYDFPDNEVAFIDLFMASPHEKRMILPL